ncbi:hypothetical protein MM1S1540310_4412 [Mycobacteroides abscessus subsp. bolletii 1S-154-0310]|nr:hypothetical protein MA5S0422_5406 [Mycobacteroides abscessus 5S-0422]EIU06281.1 hypothetical protein MA5S0421_4465 [Mycobacteroides abscessus 5S-0421]EIU22192.1 hypothetical protein MA5S0708_4158 [Mycobacteroides abscessus 5S-0708]EIU23670.1 hypothetical protein MA5S0817_3779 [Mycobacteroides abscessus 5S-0817]EIU28954.1 hypothetical protein MA5S1212_3915 [Mycobacteroides abscessus 5S-1212]EIU43653.1 hypothetical protein MA5S1215_4184 [Mycobacteroides abscessus 5S-1215]EIU58175.1 hypothet
MWFISSYRVGSAMRAYRALVADLLRLHLVLFTQGAALSFGVVEDIR